MAHPPRTMDELRNVFMNMMTRFRAPLQNGYSLTESPVLADVALRVRANIAPDMSAALINRYASPTLSKHFQTLVEGDMGMAFVHFIHDNLAKTAANIGFVYEGAASHDADSMREEVLRAVVRAKLTPQLILQSLAQHLPKASTDESGALTAFLDYMQSKQITIDVLASDIYTHVGATDAAMRAEMEASIASINDRDGKRIGGEYILPYNGLVSGLR